MDRAAPRFFVRNLGCKVNRVESDTMTAQIAAMGAVPSALNEAELVVVNTCTVTAEADRKARKEVNRALAAPLAPVVVVTGCAAAIHPEMFTALGDRVVAQPDRTAVPHEAAAVLGLDEQAAQGSVFARAGEGFATRAGIKVQDGCDNACTYCIVHTARGPAKSRDAAEVVEEVALAVASGVGEVVLTGINLGRYESQFDGRDVDLAALLDLLLGRTSVGRVRLSSIEPPEVGDELGRIMAQGGERVAHHLHIPLQSGCDRTLTQMGRTGDTSDYARVVDMLRGCMPDLALTTDVIVGFPGETDEDFAASLSFCEQMRFSKMHVFRYSRREGTPAAARTDQVPPATMAARAQTMRTLGDRMRREDAAARVGAKELVVIEREGQGTSGSYHEVLLPDAPYGARGLVRAQIVRVADSGALVGKII